MKKPVNLKKHDFQFQSLFVKVENDYQIFFTSKGQGKCI